MRIAAFCLCWVFLLTAPGVMAQQTITTKNQSWDVLRQLKAGEKLRVERKTGKKFSGKLISLSDTDLAIERRGKTVSFGRDEVKNAWLVALPSGRKRAIFAAVGGGVGLFTGGLIALGLAFKECQPNCGDEKAGQVAAVVGLSVGGALAGRAMAGSGKRTLIYSAP